jgi:hypothetical protein
MSLKCNINARRLSLCQTIISVNKYYVIICIEYVYLHPGKLIINFLHLFCIDIQTF